MDSRSSASRASRHRNLGANILVGAASSSVAGCITNPIDVIKTEMQMSKGNLGLVGTFRDRIANKGVTSLWAGLPPMILRSFFYAGLRLGTYDPIKDLLGGKENPTMFRKILAGTLSGSLGAAAANPVEVVKTRIQADPSRYRSTGAAFMKMASKEGFGSFSKGLVPHVLRGAAVTASQIGIYDDTKFRLKQHFGFAEGVSLRLVSSMVAGLVTTTVSSPFDVIKTRSMIMVNGGVVQTVRTLFAEEGMRGFFKGWVANYSRLGPHTVIVFMVFEQVRYMAGLGTL